MRIRITLLGFILAVAFCGCALKARIKEAGLVSCSFNYGKIARLMEKEAQVSNVSIDGFQRDTIGSKLFIRFSFRQDSEQTFRTAIVTSEGISLVQGFAMVVYDDSAEPIFHLEGSKGHYDNEGGLFWKYDKANFVFKAGPVVSHSDLSGFNNVLGGDYMLVKLPGKTVWAVSKLSNPTQPIFDLPPSLDHPECATFENGELVIVGRSKLPHGEYGVNCLVYRESSLGYQLSEEIPLPWANSVYDLNAKSGDALFSGNAQMFAGYYRFNIKTKRRTRLGFAPSDNVLFLQKDVIHTLDDAISKSR